MAVGTPKERKEPTANRSVRRKTKTRMLILKAASELFREKGVSNTVVSDVTERADVAYGSFYNHFKAMKDVAAAVAELTIQEVTDKTGELSSRVEEAALLPCIGGRVVIRLLCRDPACRWLLEEPLIFVDEFNKIAKPWMKKVEKKGVSEGIFRPAGGHECWLRAFPWILISELMVAVDAKKKSIHEENLALIALRFLGVDEGAYPYLLAESLRVVDEANI